MISNNCDKFNTCNICKLCGDEFTSNCKCDWVDNSCQTTYPNYTITKNWFNVLKYCNNNDYKFCSSKKYTNKDLLEKSIQISLKKDEQDYYGHKFIFCEYDYCSSTIQDKVKQIEVIINFHPEIDYKKRPKIVLQYASIKDNLISGLDEINDNYTKIFQNEYEIKISVLLIDDYIIQPFSITIQEHGSHRRVRLYIIFGIIAFIIWVIFIFLLYYYNKNKKKLIQNRINREIERRFNNEDNLRNELIKKENQEKLDQLFQSRLKEHLYKAKYNQYGGGCSICLDNFTIESKVSKTSCNHIFHHKCLKEWLFKNILCPKCPNCNSEILKLKEDEGCENFESNFIDKKGFEDCETDNVQNSRNIKMIHFQKPILDNHNNFSLPFDINSVNTRNHCIRNAITKELYLSNADKRTT